MLSGGAWAAGGCRTCSIMGGQHRPTAGVRTLHSEARGEYWHARELVRTGDGAEGGEALRGGRGARLAADDGRGTGGGDVQPLRGPGPAPAGRGAPAARRCLPPSGVARAR